MAPDDSGSNIHRLWQSQTPEEARMSIDVIRVRARQLETRVSRRNLREYVAAAVVVALFGVSAWRETNAIVIAGCLVTCLAALFVVYQLRAGGTARPMASDLGLTDALTFHRAELVRQRDLLRDVWSWYLLPFVPGMVLILIGSAQERPGRWLATAVAATVCGAMLIGVGALNQRVARQVQRMIDELDQTTK